MHHFEIERTLPHSANRVWTLVDDFANTYVYHPIVERSFSVNGKNSGLGAIRQCDLYSGQNVQETVTAHDAAERRYSLEVTEGQMPVNHMGVEVEVVDAGNGKSTLAYRIDLQPKFGPLGWVMARTMMIPAFKKMLGRVIDGIDQHLTTGQEIGKNGVPHGGPASS